MKRVKMTRGKFSLVDDDVFEFVKDWKWYPIKMRHTFVAGRPIYSEGKKLTTYLHHCVIGHPLGRKPVDHIDGDGLNNLRSNLRIVSIRQNQQNTIHHRAGRIVGASPCKDGRFYCSMSINGKVRNLGKYATAEEAGRVYQETLRQYGL